MSRLAARRAAALTAAALGGTLAAGPAAAFDFRTVVAADALLTTAPRLDEARSGTGGLRDSLIQADLGLTLRADLLRVRKRVDFRLDFWGRAGITGNPTIQELRTLSATVRDLARGRIDLTLGRFHTPGGFWLIADGLRLDVRYTGWLTHSVYGGLRAFTTARRNADLTWEDPIALPIAGTSLLLRRGMLDLSLTFTWAQEALDFSSRFDPVTMQLSQERHVENEFFLDAQALLLPSSSVVLAGGASLGTRYDVRFGSSDPIAPATIGVATLGALSAWGVVEWRPWKRLRVSYTVNYERIRLVETQLAFLKPDMTPVAGANGSFLDDAIRLVVVPWRSLRIDLQYRLRYRENTDLQNHVVLGVRGDDLWRGLGGFASIGFDVISPGVTRETVRVLYSGGLSFVRRGLDVRAGVLFTDGIGSGLLFSRPQAAADGKVPTDLFPYVLESNRVAFIRFFGTWRGFFVGVDVEENLDRVQLRGLVQVGYAR